MYSLRTQRGREEPEVREKRYRECRFQREIERRDGGEQTTRVRDEQEGNNDATSCLSNTPKKALERSQSGPLCFFGFCLSVRENGERVA
jgi:hypothetical protein